MSVLIVGIIILILILVLFSLSLFCPKTAANYASLGESFPLKTFWEPQVACDSQVVSSNKRWSAESALDSKLSNPMFGCH